MNMVIRSATMLVALLMLVSVGVAQPDSNPKADGGTPVTFRDIVGQLAEGIPEEQILEQLQKSPTVFVLDAKQEQALKRLGASDKLIAAMQRARSGGEAAEISDLAIIFDVSKSMLERTRDGRAKIEVARQVVADLVRNIPEGLQVTFVIYGHDPKRLCGVDVVRPLGELDEKNKAELATLIANVRPEGNTPIDASLQVAARELEKSSSACGIVLITDGKESCRGNPERTAAALAKNPRFTFGVNVIGFGLQPDEQRSVERIATAGQGKYYNADSAEAFAQALQQVRKELETRAPQQRESRQFQAAGKDAGPGTFFHDAPLVRAGEYKDELAFSQADFYRVPVRQGQELRAIVQIVKAPLESDLHPLDQAVRQDFVLTIYGEDMQVLGREELKVLDNPQRPATLRSVYTPDKDGTIYVSIGASANYDNWGNERGPLKNKPKASQYSLRLRLDGEAAEVAAGDAPLNLLKTEPGSDFQSAGEIQGEGLAVGDLKLGESAYYSLPVEKGETLEVSVAAQKPFESGQNRSLLQIPKGKYVLTIYDDDQVEVATKEFEITGNPPDAQGATLTWPVNLTGNAYIAVSLSKAGKNHDDPNAPPPPGRFGLRVSKTPR